MSVVTRLRRELTVLVTGLFRAVTAGNRAVTACYPRGTGMRRAVAACYALLRPVTGPVTARYPPVTRRYPPPPRGSGMLRAVTAGNRPVTWDYFVVCLDCGGGG